MNRRLRLVLVAILLVVVVALAWFLLLAPVRDDIAATDTSINDERTKLSAAQARLAQAEITRQEGRMNQGRLLELAKLVPDSHQIPSLLLEIQDLAEQSGVDLISITPGDPVEGAGYQILPLELQFTGTFFDLSDFVYRAEQMAAAPGRLLAIKNVRLQLGQETAEGTASGASVSPQLEVGMTLYAFVMGSATTTTAGQAAQPATEAGNETQLTTTTTTP